MSESILEDRVWEKQEQGSNVENYHEQVFAKK